MRMGPLSFVSLLLISTAALARPTFGLTDASAEAGSGRTLLSAEERELPPVVLADYHGAAPVHPAQPVRPVRPAPLRPRYVSGGGSASALLIGLGLVAGGLVLGGAGFAVLYLCQAGSACYSETTTIIGWVLAAPGIIPLTIGAILVYASLGGSGRVLAPSPSSSQRWAFGFAPLRDGGVFSAATVF